MAPVEDIEDYWAKQRDNALQRVWMFSSLFLVVQVVAIVEFVVSLVVLWRVDLDVLVTVGMIWSLSVPCAAGAVIFALRVWTLLTLIERFWGMAPWSVLLLELTVVAWKLAW